MFSFRFGPVIRNTRLLGRMQPAALMPAAGESFRIRLTYSPPSERGTMFRRVYKIATISFVMFVHLSAWNNSAPTGRILMKLDTLAFFENMSRKFKFH
jgi:hypothetical protein